MQRFTISVRCSREGCVYYNIDPLETDDDDFMPTKAQARKWAREHVKHTRHQVNVTEIEHIDSWD